MNDYLPALKTVVIGSSLEDESDQVVRTGLAVARAAGACVYLVHAVRIEPLVFGSEAGLPPDFSQDQIAWREEALQRQIQRLGIAESELAGAAVQMGAPYRVLLDVARTATAGLIVVGATGSGPFAAELLGSTADRVMRTANCPVLIVRGELRVPPQNVLAPVDLSTLSADAFRCGLRFVAQLAKGSKVNVRAVYAMSFLDALALQRQKLGEIPSEQVERCAGEELSRFVLENRPEAVCRVESAVLPGEARVEILRELREHPVDLVILGTHGRGGLNRLAMGSVASNVARKAPCSVLLISPDTALGQSIAEAVLDRTTPAWHREPIPVA